MSQYDTNSYEARFTGILRGQESFAQAVSFGINTRDWYRGRVPMVVNTILLGAFFSPPRFIRFILLRSTFRVPILLFTLLSFPPLFSQSLSLLRYLPPLT